MLPGWAKTPFTNDTIELRLLRNRVMHHKAINQTKIDLQRHIDIHEAIRWISPTLGKAIQAVNNFPAIFNAEPKSKLT